MAHPHLIPVLAGTLVAAVSVAPLEAKATARTRPAGATAQCNDGTYSKAKSEQGACSSHGGVKTWYGEAAKPAPPPRARSVVKPADATAECADGTYSSAKTERGACSSHGGVKTWYGEAKAPPAPAPVPPIASPSPMPPASRPGTSAPGTAQVPPRTAPAGAPEGATAKCKDGTFSHSKTHTGACSHHGGVAEWYR